MSASPKPSLCRICKEYCGILVSMDQGRVAIKGNPEHPVSRGFLCPRGAHYAGVHHSPERLTQPLLRGKSGFKPLSLADALDLLAEKLDAARQKHGPQSLAFYKGEALKHQEVTRFLKHLTRALGSPNYYSVSSICHYAMNLAHSLTYGGIPAPDYASLRAMLLWGVNPAVSMPRTYKGIKAAKQSGTPLVVVDPFATPTARLADLHLPVRPGRDGLLALAFLKQAAAVGPEPPAERSVGWGEMRAMLDGLELEELLAASGITPGLFQKAVDMLMGSRPVWVMTGLGLELAPNGVQSLRAIACLHALMNPGLVPPRLWAGLPGLPGEDGYPELAAPVGGAEAPIYARRVDEAQGMYLPEAVLEGKPYPVRALLAAGGNPMMTFPQPDLQAGLLDSLDFLAVFDLFMTPTAKRADLVLPAADTLSWTELHDYGGHGHPYLGLLNPVLDDGPGISVFEVIFGLAQRMGLDRFFPWSDYRQALGERLAQGGVDMADLESSPTCTIPHPGPAPQQEPVSFNFRSMEVEAAGLPGLPGPDAVEPPADVDGDFPFFLCTGDRLPGYQHSQFRNIPPLRRLDPEPWVEAHPDAAAALGLGAGDLARLSTRQGEISLKLRLNKDLRPDCLRMTHGWEEANANRLGSASRRDPISGFPWLRCLPARLEPAAI